MAAATAKVGYGILVLVVGFQCWQCSILFKVYIIIRHLISEFSLDVITDIIQFSSKCHHFATSFNSYFKCQQMLSLTLMIYSSSHQLLNIAQSSVTSFVMGTNVSSTSADMPTCTTKIKCHGQSSRIVSRKRLTRKRLKRRTSGQPTNLDPRGETRSPTCHPRHQTRHPYDNMDCPRKILAWQGNGGVRIKTTEQIVSSRRANKDLDPQVGETLTFRS